MPDDEKASEPRIRTNRIIQLSTREFVNHETGEVTSSEHATISRLPKEPEYIKLYLQDVSRILDVPPGPQSLLMALIRKLDWEGMITLSARSRVEIAEKLKIKVHTLTNYLGILCEQNILKRIGRGEFEVNPHLLAKGDWQEIQKRRANFRLTVIYRPDGTREISGGLEEQEELDLVQFHPKAAE